MSAGLKKKIIDGGATKYYCELIQLCRSRGDKYLKLSDKSVNPILEEAAKKYKFSLDGSADVAMGGGDKPAAKGKKPAAGARDRSRSRSAEKQTKRGGKAAPAAGKGRGRKK